MTIVNDGKLEEQKRLHNDGKLARCSCGAADFESVPNLPYRNRSMVNAKVVSRSYLCRSCGERWRTVVIKSGSHDRDD